MADAKATATAEDRAEDRLDFKKVLPVFVIILIDLLGLTIIIPVLPLYSVSFGAGPVIYGLVGAAYPVMQFLGAPFLGRLSDRFGRRPVLLISELGTLAGFIMLGLADALWMIFLARLIDGISGANISTAQAVITDSTSDKTRTQGLGLIGAAFGIGFVFGPVIALIALALSGNNYAVPAFVAAGFSLLSILLTWFWLEETLPAEQRGQVERKGAFSFATMLDALRRPGVGVLLVLMFFQQLAFGAFTTMLALFTLNRLGMSASNNSVLFVFVGVLIVAVQGYFVGRWSRSLGERKLIYLGLAALAVGLVLAATTPARPVPWYSREAVSAELSGGRRAESLAVETPPTQDLAVPLPDADAPTGWLGLGWLLAAMIPVSVGSGVLQPSINSLLTKRVGPDEVGGTLGVSAAFLSGSNAFAPVVGGALFEGFGASAPFVVGGVIQSVLFVLALVFVKPGREESGEG
jgi:DHA1 family tetracycline resistance protein-like MFS transporter